MQRTSIEFERQRHLANWFIKSSPHMANGQSFNPNGNDFNNSGNIIIPSISGGGGGGPRSRLFNSQTNLPLQIVTTTSSSAQDGHKLKLRRFNSHDTSANMFSVAEFENARLARRNEIELKQRKQQKRLKINSSNISGDCSTGDSKTSKNSNDSQPEPLPADIF